MTWTALADLARDIAGALPAEAFARWEDPANRSDDLAEEILAPFRTVGTVVCSDTAGLSKMAIQLPLPVVLKRIGEPKQRIHAAGTGLGGRAIGTWVADNTEMLYPPQVSVDEITTAMAAIHAEGLVPVGFCIHVGVFYDIGGGLYGPDADQVEMLAEDHTGGGDTLITPAAMAALAQPEAFQRTARDEGVLGTVYNVTTANTPAPTNGDTAYPRPYDDAMNELLAALDEGNPETVLSAIEARYRSEMAVLLIQRSHRRPVRSPLETVDALLSDLHFQQVTQPILGEACQYWTVSGNLALAAFPSVDEAVGVARELRSALGHASIITTGGIDWGSVYLFPMDGSRHEFAGDPVNRASKLAEDLADPGALLITARAARLGSGIEGAAKTWSISGLRIDGLLLSS